MPYTTPPTFNDGSILSASQLNILSDDIEYLYGLSSGINPPFATVGSGTDVAQNANIWKIRHAGRYLHYRVSIDGGQHDDLRLYYNDDLIYQDNGSENGPFTWSGYIDLNNTGIISPTPTIGTFYNMTWAFTWNTEAFVTLHYLIESDNTSI